MSEFHKLKITGSGSKTKIMIDDKEVNLATRLEVILDASNPPKAILELFVDPDIDIDECKFEKV